MRRRIVAALFALVVMLGALPSYAAAETFESPDLAGIQPVALSSALHPDHLVIAANAVPAAVRTCNYTIKGEDPHISHSSKNYAVQSHGYWENKTCPGGLKATVTTTIQKLTKRGWVNVGTSGTKTVYSGGGRGKRSTGHYDCQNRNSLNTFRVHVRVHLHGNSNVASKTGSAFSRLKQLSCG